MKRINLEKSCFKAVVILFALALLLSLLGCQSQSADEIAAQAANEQAFACVEARGATVFSFFTGSTMVRKVVVPKDSGLSKDDWVEIINRCFMDSSQVGLLEIMSSMRQTEQ